MSHSDFLKSPITRLPLLILFFTGFSTLLPGLDLTLNGRNHAVLNSEALYAHSRDSVIPLQALYPWLESVEYLEVQSGVNRVFWDSSRLGEADWNGALLVNRGGVWEIRVGRDVFSAPDRIAVRGVPLDIDTVSIWCAVDNPEFKADLLAALAMRSVDVVWRDLSQPGYLLSDPPPEGRPHLVLLDQFDIIRLDSLLSSSRPVASRRSDWLKAQESPARAAETADAMALDAYNPEAALLYLLADNPALFDADGQLPSGLVDLLNWAAESPAGELVITDTPMSTLAAGGADLGVRLPSSDEPWNPAEADMTSITPPEGAVNIIRLQYAAIPDDGDIARLVFADAVRIADIPGNQDAVNIPMDPRVVRFFDAYERIGRLAISGQMESSQVAGLINDYVNETEAGK